MVNQAYEKQFPTVLINKGAVSRSYNNKFIIASTKIKNIENFTFIAVLVFTLLSHKIVFINRKNNRN